MTQLDDLLAAVRELQQEYAEATRRHAEKVAALRKQVEVIRQELQDAQAQDPG